MTGSRGLMKRPFGICPLSPFSLESRARSEISCSKVLFRQPRFCTGRSSTPRSFYFLCRGDLVCHLSHVANPCTQITATQSRDDRLFQRQHRDQHLLSPCERQCGGSAREPSSHRSKIQSIVFCLPDDSRHCLSFHRLRLPVFCAGVDQTVDWRYQYDLTTKQRRNAAIRDQHVVRERGQNTSGASPP